MITISGSCSARPTSRLRGLGVRRGQTSPESTLRQPRTIYWRRAACRIPLQQNSNSLGKLAMLQGSLMQRPTRIPHMQSAREGRLRNVRPTRDLFMLVRCTTCCPALATHAHSRLMDRYRDLCTTVSEQQATSLWRDMSCNVKATFAAASI